MNYKYFISICASLILMLGFSACGDEKKLEVFEGQLPIKTQTLYVVGSGTTANWDNNNPLPLTVSADDPFIFVYDGYLKPGEIKLCCQKGSWDVPFIRPSEAGSPIGKTQIVDQTFIMHAGNPDLKWNVTDEGMYTLTFNLKMWTMSSVYNGPAN